MPDRETQSLEALKGRATKEIARADRTHYSEKSKQQQAHDLRVMEKEHSDKRHYRNTLLFGGIVGGLLFLLASAFFIAIFYEKYEQIEIVVSMLVFMLGHVTGLLAGQSRGR